MFKKLLALLLSACLLLGLTACVGDALQEQGQPSDSTAPSATEAPTEESTAADEPQGKFLRLKSAKLRRSPEDEWTTFHVTWEENGCYFEFGKNDTSYRYRYVFDPETRVAYRYCNEVLDEDEHIYLDENGIIIRAFELDITYDENGAPTMEDGAYFPVDLESRTVEMWGETIHLDHFGNISEVPGHELRYDEGGNLIYAAYDEGGEVVFEYTEEPIHSVWERTLPAHYTDDILGDMALLLHVFWNVNFQ